MKATEKAKCKFETVTGKGTEVTTIIVTEVTDEKKGDTHYEVYHAVTSTYRADRQSEKNFPNYESALEMASRFLP